MAKAAKMKPGCLKRVFFSSYRQKMSSKFDKINILIVFFQNLYLMVGTRHIKKLPIFMYNRQLMKMLYKDSFIKLFSTAI